MVFDYDKRQIKICDNVLDVIKKYRQYDRKSSEAGGVLVGRENISNNNLIIEFATEPLPNDKRSRSRFCRKDNGHTVFYQNMYRSNCGIYVYIGEWHTHPEAYPSYSFHDLSNWGRIGKNAGCASAQLHMIAGYSALRMWKFSYSSRSISDVITLCWNEDKKIWKA